MPFPLAHPAAVLPLRRYCPQYLNFPALVIGSLSPDLGYAFGHLHVDWFSHRFFAGTFGFCLPAGLLVLFGFYLVRRPVVGILPAPFRQTLWPLCQRPVGSPFGIVVSLVLGAWTHILLDDISHPDGWEMGHLPLLQSYVLPVGSHRFRICDLLYAGCTFGGVAWLAFCYMHWLEGAAGCPGQIGRGLKWIYAFVLGNSILLVATANRGINHSLGLTGMAIITVLLLIGFVLGTGMQILRHGGPQAAVAGGVRTAQCGHKKAGRL